MGNKETAKKNLDKAQGKQTGPKTPEGKDKSRRNALKHGIYAAKVAFGNCKGEECKFHKMGLCQFYINGDVKKGDLCVFQVENIKTRRMKLLKGGPKAGNEMMATLVALEEDTIVKAYADINERGILLEDITGQTKSGMLTTKKTLHGALDYTRKATKDVNGILHDLTGYGEDNKGDGEGFRVEEVLKALESQEKNNEGSSD